MSEAAQLVKLNGQEMTRLSALEETVERGRQTFIEVGNALSEIRESRLYRETHKTFESYCQDRWGWSRQQAGRLIRAADAAENVTQGLQKPSHRGFLKMEPYPQPTSERQTRPLTSLNKDQQPHSNRDCVVGFSLIHTLLCA